MQQHRYTRVKDYERDTISWKLSRGCSIREIARVLGRSPSTISREVNRDISKTSSNVYAPTRAGRRAGRSASRRRHGKYKLEGNAGLYSYVMDKETCQ